MPREWGGHWTVLGNVGSGKTVFNRNVLAPTANRLIILDSEDDDYPDFPNVSVARALKLAASDYSFYVRVPTTGIIENDSETIETMCRGLLEKGHDLMLLIEEATDYSDASYIPPHLRALMRRARHKKITVVISTQRPAMLSKDYYALSQHHVFFFLSDFDVTRTDYARFLKDHEGEIPYGSFKSLYQKPDNSIVILEPCEIYNWQERLGAQKGAHRLVPKRKK